ncbi:MAG: alkaline phosphatase family protein [Clostridiales bacterium]|nr:alkaline phosphatase family protein [Clostridiales bacterium]
MTKYVKLWVLPLVLILVAATTNKLARSAWDSLVQFRAPRFTVEPGGRAQSLSRVVVLIVVDGLRVDAFNKMEYVSRLKGDGAFFTLKVGQPSLTLPCSATIGTGAWQDVTGVTTNWFEGPLELDSIFSLARNNGLTSAIVADEGWGKLFGHQATRVDARKWENAYIRFDEETLEKALEVISGFRGEGSRRDSQGNLSSPSAGSSGGELDKGAGLFLLVHFLDTDNAGHDFGGASQEYQEYANRIGRLIERLHRELPEDATLVITADHGQIDRGGHGGWEDIVLRVPLLMLGKNIRPGNYGEARQTDVAPTVAALAGLPVPPYSQGRILTEALDVGAQNQEILLRLEDIVIKQKEAFTRAYLEAIGADFDKTRDKIKPLPSGSAAEYWDRVFDEGKQKKINSERAGNIPLFLAVFLLPLVALWYFKRKHGLSYRLPFLLSLLYFACYFALFFASGKRVSLSSINDEDLLQRFFNEVMLYAVIAAVIATVALAVLERRKTRYEATKSSVILVAWIAYLIALQIDIFFLWNGPLIKWYIPNMLLAFKYYLDMMTLIVVGIVSPVLPLISISTHKLSKPGGRHT